MSDNYLKLNIKQLEERLRVLEKENESLRTSGQKLDTDRTRTQLHNLSQTARICHIVLALSP